MKHLNIRIYGFVQGVFFRLTAKKEADKLNVTGFVTNMPDGSVYIEAEGEEENLDKFVKHCHIGATMARVDRVEVFEEPLKNFTKFEVY